MINFSLSLNGVAENIKPFTTENIAVVAPILNARVMTIINVVTGEAIKREKA